MPTLTLRRTSHAVHPWRLGVQDGPQWWGLPEFTFPRKREAVAMLRALEALDVDWTVPPDQWPDATWDAVCALQRTTPGWAVHQRGLQAREEGRV
jgi:hypothetical protein